MTKLFVLISCALVVVNLAAKFPATWKKCPKKNNEECLKQSIKEAIVNMKNGNKELNVIPLDPLHFERIIMDQGSPSSPVNINFTLSNLDVIGASEIEVTSAKVDWDKYSMEFEMDINKAYIAGDYNIAGKILVLPITGKGKSTMTLDNFTVIMSLNGSELIKNGKKYFNVGNAGLFIRVKKVLFNFENLFEGQKELGDNMNKFLSDNWQEIMKELNGTISSALGLAVKQVASNVFKKIPVTDLYT